MPVCYQDLKTSIQHYILYGKRLGINRSSTNHIAFIHPSTAHWAAVPVRRHDVSLTRLRIGHIRLTHRHLGESPPSMRLLSM
ncbi:hypothetical protein TNCV_3310571 [Trichonephila clavipes]|nr:hypothetical protein TNCV_3310571 [Trichonephila clavipes]